MVQPCNVVVVLASLQPKLTIRQNSASWNKKHKVQTQGLMWFQLSSIVEVYDIFLQMVLVFQMIIVGLAIISKIYKYI